MNSTVLWRSGYVFFLWQEMQKQKLQISQEEKVSHAVREEEVKWREKCQRKVGEKEAKV